MRRTHAQRAPKPASAATPTAVPSITSGWLSRTPTSAPSHSPKYEAPHATTGVRSQPTTTSRGASQRGIPVPSASRLPRDGGDPKQREGQREPRSGGDGKHDRTAHDAPDHRNEGRASQHRHGEAEEGGVAPRARGAAGGQHPSHPPDEGPQHPPDG